MFKWLIYRASNCFYFPVTPAFKINYTSLERDLKRIEKLYGKHREIDILRSNLSEYKSLFKL